jgi:glycosyltransferase involved in cell wall biosynthesis
MRKRILIITDAHEPQINGVVTTLKGLVDHLKEEHFVRVIHPGMFKTFPMPMYPEIQLAKYPWKMKELIRRYRPKQVHIATEGPLGLYARLYCAWHRIPYTTSYHTNFPEFIEAFTKIPSRFIYPLIRWFHGGASSILVTTETMRTNLEAKGFRNLVVWNRAVDVDLFNPSKRDDALFADLPRPIWMNVGRVSVEKNIPAFLDLDLPGTKVMVGDGPARAALEQRYPDVVWTGAKRGEDLARHFASADVFVFPSLTDTFGLVMIEAMASGVPVAAFPVTGPIDVVKNGVNGDMNTNLREACLNAHMLRTEQVREYVVENHSWESFVAKFLDSLVDIPLEVSKKLRISID